MIDCNIFRNDAQKHLKRFEEEFGSGDNDRLKYAALELRMAMEARYLRPCACVQGRVSTK